MATKYVKLEKIEIVEFGVDGHTFNKMFKFFIENDLISPMGSIKWASLLVGQC